MQVRRLQVSVARAAANFLVGAPEFKTQNVGENIREFLRRKDVTAALTTLKSLANGTRTTSDPVTTAIAVATSILDGARAGSSQGRKGRKMQPAAEGLLRAIYLSGGEDAYRTLAANLNLADSRTIRKKNELAQCFFVEGLCDGNFEQIASIYKRWMSQQGLTYGSLLVLMSEDETAVVPDLGWDHVTDCLVGTCGRKCNRGCLTVASLAPTSTLASGITGQVK